VSLRGVFAFHDILDDILGSYPSVGPFHLDDNVVHSVAGKETAHGYMKPFLLVILQQMLVNLKTTAL
jgi:hypothetical protein